MKTIAFNNRENLGIGQSVIAPLGQGSNREEYM